MNQRIRELALQANAHETGHAYYRGEKKPENAVTLHSVDLELFAELIVQRTLDIVEAHTEIFQSDEARAMVEHIKQSVKTDLGVDN